jgi:hypothetical protein
MVKLTTFLHLVPLLPAVSIHVLGVRQRIFFTFKLNPYYYFKMDGLQIVIGVNLAF